MRTNGYQSYVDEEVLAANPRKLVLLLYSAALDSIASARRYLRLGDIRARSRAINKAMRIVTELSLSLSGSQHPELTGSLAELYAYVETLLIRANTGQCDPPLAEAERLLGTLASAWEAESESIPGPLVAEEASLPVSCTY